MIKYLEKPILYDDLVKVFNSVVTHLEDNNLLFTKLTKDYYYFFTTKKIVTKEKEIILTKNEILFLELLLDKPNQLISKESIEENVFKESVDENTLRNLVYRLRKKMECDIIVTIKDLGYLIKMD